MTVYLAAPTVTRVIRAASYGRACEAAKAQGVPPGGWTYVRSEDLPPSPDVVTTAFGRLLRELREAAALTQTKLAGKAGVDTSYVSRIESGARMPSREAVARLAAHLGEGALDQLLTAAGFLPVDVSSLLSSEPAVADILEILGDEGFGAAYRDGVRAVLAAVAGQARAIRADAAEVTP